MNICPLCGAKVMSGYGLMGGGIGPYEFCENEACDYFLKTQDSEYLAAPRPQEDQP